MAKELNATVVTNDKHLRTACLGLEIKVIRGLQLLIELIKTSDYSIDDANNIGEQIYASNTYISKEIIDDFIKKLENIRNNKI